MCYFEKQRVQGNQIWHSQTEPDPTRPDHYDDDDYDDDDYDVDDDYDDNDPPLRKLSENSSSLVRAIIPNSAPHAVGWIEVGGLIGTWLALSVN